MPAINHDLTISGVEIVGANIIVELSNETLIELTLEQIISLSPTFTVPDQSDDTE